MTWVIKGTGRYDESKLYAAPVPMKDAISSMLGRVADKETILNVFDVTP
jgi:hypothetical protein